MRGFAAGVFLVLGITACGSEQSDAGPTAGASIHRKEVGLLPVYRFAKISNGAYFYTGSESEKNVIQQSYPDFRYEGVAFHRAEQGAEDAVPVHRYANLNTGGYFYTASEAERSVVDAQYPHMRYEGVSFSVVGAARGGANAVYRLANLRNGAYLYTASAEERTAALALGFWRDEGVGYWAPTRPISKSFNSAGAWSASFSWPLVAIHAGLLADGRVMSFGGVAGGPGPRKYNIDVWDPALGIGSSSHMTYYNESGANLFCSNQMLLPGGDMLMAGGEIVTNGVTHGIPDTTIFDPDTGSFSAGPRMNRPRWYATLTTMPNEEVYVQGGLDGADYAELRTAGGAYRLLTGMPTGSLEWWYPRNYLTPDGRVFGHDSEGRAYRVTPVGDGRIDMEDRLPMSSQGGWASGAMFAPGKILQCGGNSSDCVVIDINGPRTHVTPTASLSSKRMWLNATVLADGSVLATGGSDRHNELVGVNNTAEIWNPQSGRWTVGPSAAHPRLYHSIAMLLPDASVLVAGGGAPGPITNENAELYWPPYLFNGDKPAARPVIVDAPEAVTPGETATLRVAPGDAIARVTLVQIGGVTHSINMQQRFVELDFEQTGDTLSVRFPIHGADVPPGYYMIFALDHGGVPSIARIARVLRAPVEASIPWTTELGSGGTSDYRSDCGSRQVLAGIHGRSAGGVTAIGAICVDVDAGGRWASSPAVLPAAGEAGTAFQVQCAADHAVARVDIRDGAAINQIRLGCRPLKQARRLEGAASLVYSAWGGSGSGGTEQSALCGDDRPAWSLFGRRDGSVQTVGLLCRRDAAGS